jgi:hypothetical protein
VRDWLQTLLWTAVLTVVAFIMLYLWFVASQK